MEGSNSMSKILAAMNKSSLDTDDLMRRIRTHDHGSLMPPPDQSQVSEFEQLANSLINLHGGKSGEAVVFASTYSGEGSSFVSYNCARCLALLLNRKIAWIDANFKNPQKKLRGTTPDLKALLANPSLVSDISGVDELVVISGGKSSQSTMDLLHGDQYSEFLDKMKDECFLTIIDAPPILEEVEAAHLVRNTLGLILVVESERLKHEVIQHGLERMRNQNVNVLGTVLNRRSFQLPGFLYERL
jgi:Mrp family chromosome partitioning ATPase